MSIESLEGIAQILNRTNYRVLAWYFNPMETKKLGLKDALCIGSMSMMTTGNQKFTVHVYIRTFKYINIAAQTPEDSSEESVSEEVKSPIV